MTYEITPERDKVLKEAKERADKARDLLRRQVDLKVECLVFVPTSSLYATSKQKEKSRKWADVIDRLDHVVNRPGEIIRNYEWQDSEAKKKADEITKKEKDKEIEKSYLEFTQRAIIWVQNKGKVLGRDFTLENVVAFANGIAFDEEVKRKLESGTKGFTFFQFSGQNCDECPGWDGSSNRCSCGNRRVYWTADPYSHSFEGPYVYAEAY